MLSLGPRPEKPRARRVRGNSAGLSAKSQVHLNRERQDLRPTVVNENRSGGAVHEACPPHNSAGIVANMTTSTVAEYLAALPADRRAARRRPQDDQ